MNIDESDVDLTGKVVIHSILNQKQDSSIKSNTLDYQDYLEDLLHIRRLVMKRRLRAYRNS